MNLIYLFYTGSEAIKKYRLFKHTVLDSFFCKRWDAIVLGNRTQIHTTFYSTIWIRIFTIFGIVALLNHILPKLSFMTNNTLIMWKFCSIDNGSVHVHLLSSSSLDVIHGWGSSIHGWHPQMRFLYPWMELSSVRFFSCFTKFLGNFS